MEALKLEILRQRVFHQNALGAAMGVVGPSTAGSGLYNQVQDANKKSPLTLHVSDAENGYVVHVNGRTYVAENAEQVAGILTTQLIARGGS
jgi:hypothetical protein